MPVGRKPKPTFLHLVEGTLRPHRHSRRQGREPQPVGNLSDPPGWFSEGQRDVWAYVLRHAPPGLLKAIDWSTVGAFCVACDLHRQAVELLNELGSAGLVVPSGQQHALVGILNRQAEIMLKHASELGFSPTSRARVTVDPRAAVNPFDEFA